MLPRSSLQSQLVEVGWGNLDPSVGYLRDMCSSLVLEFPSHSKGQLCTGVTHMVVSLYCLPSLFCLGSPLPPGVSKGHLPKELLVFKLLSQDLFLSETKPR